jgi:solute:Na+ symporter, SSS family
LLCRCQWLDDRIYDSIRISAEAELLTNIVLSITVIFCLLFLVVSLKVKESAASSFAMYAIGGGALPLYLILFSDVATILGAGNVIGHATEGFQEGISHLPFVLGEQGSKIVFALVFAGFAGRFAYITISELMYDLLHKDRISRVLSGVLSCTILLAWLAGQAKGLGYIFHQFTDISPVPVIILFNVVFVIYTYLGGILSVVWTDLIQGILIMVFGSVFYFLAFAPIEWSPTLLASKLTEVAGPEFLSFSHVSTVSLFESFFIGLFGVLAAQIYWQRCFAAKDAQTARLGMLISGILVVVLVSLTTMVGMTIRALNPDIDPALAMPWFIMNYMPLAVVATTYSLILAAAMSSADSILNSTAIVVVNDIVYPFRPDMTDQQLIKWSKRATLLIGVLGTFLALYADSIIGMFSKAYAMAGGAIVPVLIVGLVWKRSRKPFKQGELNSHLTAWGVRVALVSGATASVLFNIFWGIALSTILAVIVSLWTRPSDQLCEG